MRYKAPVRDAVFCLHEVLHAEKHWQELGFEADRDTTDMVLSESGKLCEEILAPLNEVGDSPGCVYDPATANVTTPPGFKQAFKDYVDAGWHALSVPKKYGGSGLAPSLNFVKAEFIAESNWAWGMYTGLAQGAMNTLLLHASDELKDTYLTKLSTGEYLGTMCLTEPHCGTDLGLCKTRAVPVDPASNTYKLNGTKIFISCGEHDFTENIIHIVLAKLPDAPAGTDGISLFLVPKFLLKKDGTLETKKNITCGGIEHKMGIHGSSTCIMNFDDSIGYMIGEPNTGLKQMFTFMNSARIGVGIQGLGACEQSYQLSLPYALERGSLRALSGTKYPERPNDPLIVHGDIRRMLLTQRAFAEGGRCFTYYTSMLSDYWLTEKRTAEEKKELDKWLGFFTPILKGFLTEVSLEAASNGIQIFGGHGYIRHNGVEQVYRDARIGTIYEGTTAIQALDLLGRKVLANGGKYLRKYLAEIRSDIDFFGGFSEGRTLFHYTLKWGYISMKIGKQAASNRDVVGVKAFDYLMFSGYVTLAHFWLKMAKVAETAAKNNPAEADFYQNKIHLMKFYYDMILPRADTHYKILMSDENTLFAIRDDKFSIE